MTTRVSVDSAGLEGNNTSYRADISGDGRYVTFASYANNLVVGDTNGQPDVFLHDRWTGTTVVFYSFASNLVAGDTNSASDCFVHEIASGATTRVSVTSGGGQASGSSFYPSISDDGNVVGFYSYASDLVAADTNAAQDCFVHDRTTGVTRRVSVDSAGVEGVSDSLFPVVAGDGSAVVFLSLSANLVAGDTNGAGDIFVHQLSSGVTTRASLADSGAQANSGSTNPDISANGQFVAFGSFANNLVAGDANGQHDVFVRDRGAVSSGPSLSVSGACGGVMDFDVTGATPGGAVVFVSGPPGMYVKPTPPCAGLTLDVSPPTIRATVVADAAGNASVSGMFVPASACGLGVQAVDAATCTPTGMVVL